LINASEFAWKNPYLFVQSNLKTVEIQNNLNVIEFNIRKMIAKTITECINIQEIIEFLDEIMEASIQKKQKKLMKAKNISKDRRINQELGFDAIKTDEIKYYENTCGSEQQNNEKDEKYKEDEDIEDEEDEEDKDEIDEDEEDKDEIDEDEEDKDEDEKNEDEEDVEDEDEKCDDKDKELDNLQHNVQDDVNEYDKDIIQDVIDNNIPIQSESESESDIESESENSDLDASDISSDNETTEIKHNITDIKIVNINDPPIKSKTKPKRSSFF
jgi:hypothetical protein